MGTNYYATPKACDHCGRGDEKVHIGKNGTMVQCHTESPWGPIRSFADWAAVLRGHSDITVKDEYDRVMTAQELIDYFMSSPPEQRRRQYDWVQSHPRTHHEDRDFLDDDGFSCNYDWFG